MRQTALQRWAAQNPKRALVLWSATAGNLIVGTLLSTIGGDAISCPLDGGSAVTCDDPSKAGDPVLTVVAWMGFTMLLLGVASIIGAIAWYIVRLKREVDAGKR
ncbi:hypothetical protein [Streptomyces sp. NPDC001642]|uniref:hypothetical protein n=1 Tax=Streptomyces sp. NPDC001642 TaxID=3154392 RepID=UPI00332827E8